MLLIWLGAVVMMLGGALSLSDRRLRVGAPKPAAQSRAGAGGVGRMRRLALMFLLVALSAPAAFAVTPDEMLKDPALEARARHISQGLRCMVCQNQSIDDSDAPLAHDLRVLVRERLEAGDSDKQVVDFLVARYGEFVLLKPPVELRHAVAVGTAAGGASCRRDRADRRRAPSPRHRSCARAQRSRTRQARSARQTKSVTGTLSPRLLGAGLRRFLVALDAQPDAAVRRRLHAHAQIAMDKIAVPAEFEIDRARLHRPSMRARKSRMAGLRPTS